MSAAAGRPLTEFVDRDDELAHLEALLARAEAGRGQVLAVVGEPGVGKSRLLQEFRRRIAGRAITWLEGHCRPEGDAYGPVLEILRQCCGHAEEDRPEAIAAKVHASLREVGMDASTGAPLLLRLFGLADGEPPLDGRVSESTKARTFDVLRQMALGGSRRRPLVIVVEDLHWVDATSEEFAASLVERAASAPLLLVFTYRPGYRPRGGDRSSGTQLSLSALGPVESYRLVRGLPGGGTLSDQVTGRILAKAEGNPLFLEELTRAALETGGPGLEARAPSTVQEVVRTRVDRLPERARRVLQCAAVLGRQSSPALLRAVCDEPALDGTLRMLTHLELLEERFGARESTFVFKHALVQQVIYESIPEPQRRALHDRVDRQRYAARPAEGAALVAPD